MTEIDIKHLREWIGQEEKVEDRLTLERAEQMVAILNHPDPTFKVGAHLPLGWQWIYFNPVVRSEDLDVDGHPKRGGFLPPVPLQRRMWAAGAMTLHTPLRVDVAAERRSTVQDVVLKEGRTGPLVFVTVQHEFWQEGALNLEETQNIVYREAGTQKTPSGVLKSESPNGEWQETLRADEILLFRYSAVTFNAHRIHHDERYVKEVEGYPGLIVHGPLLATQLIEFANRHTNQDRLESFRFRAKQPIFVNQPYTLHGSPGENKMDLWITDEDNQITMEAEATVSGL